MLAPLDWEVICFPQNIILDWNLTSTTKTGLRYKGQLDVSAPWGKFVHARYMSDIV